MELYKVFRPDLSREGTLADDQTWERVKLTYEEVGYLQSLEEMEDFRVVLWERILSDEKYACLWFGELERMLLVRRKQLLNQEPVATPYWDALMRVYGK